MSETRCQTMKLSQIHLDVFKHILSFTDALTIASFGRTCKESYQTTRKFYLDTVRQIAIIDIEGCYYIQSISSDEKDRKIKDLVKMTCTDLNQNISIQYLLINQMKTNLFTWARFVPKHYRSAHELNETKGYWKLLDINKATIINDLNAIKSMVMHKEIAPKLLAYDDYKSNENPFKMEKITVCIKGNNNKYDILFWNGASPNQCNTFQIYDHQKKRKYYFMNFRSDLNNVSWMWYDNDLSKFREYGLGSNVKAQIECSFQANILHNFPLEFQTEKVFNNTNLTELKKELINKFGESKNHRNKLFALRCGFNNIDSPNRSIANITQQTHAIYGYSTFSRSVQRINDNQPTENDLSKIIKNGFNLRMQPKCYQIQPQKV